MHRFSILEIFVAELVLWLGLWLADEYLAGLLTLILASIVWAVLVIAQVAEWIEPTRVPRRYFRIMLASGLAPLVAAGAFWAVKGFL